MQVNRKRIPSLDMIRGVALIGILVSHSILFHAATIDIASIDSYMRLFIVLFIDTKFVAIFSFLFGYGSFLFIMNARRNNTDDKKLYRKRLAILFPIGFVMYAINPHIAPILMLYVVIGYILTFVFDKTIGTIGVVIIMLFMLDMIVILFMEKSFFIHYCLVVFTMMLLGYYVARLDVVSKVEIYRKKLLIIASCSVIVTICGLGLALMYYQKGTLIRYENNFVEFTTLYMSMLYIMALFFWFRRRYVNILATYGRLSLTNYIIQSILIILIARIMPAFTQPMATIITILLVLSITVIQMIFSIVWLKYYISGPVEWIWNWYTYTSTSAKKRLS
ncbi:DUF418 domain-containing protein [Priestia taiwanensis]|uniref:Membrane protein n=1 Tax=Priestia taiwanensis TaxID=1347902 RepID=A0A917AP19_9BACI|nr:DUF418 domain-containing protein [Priestia taiwanensis]MBM7362491.1 putative membrane protein YeiB [Priestia taiwanensis]GGE62640.1 membrane protein [Priestia taiwanensis]